MVDGVSNDDVVARLRRHLFRKQHEALRLVEPCGGLDGVDGGGLAVSVASGPGAVGAQHRLEVVTQLNETVVPGVGYQPGAPVTVLAAALVPPSDVLCAPEP
ncbi:hypothetical protein AHiyo4_48890 [Arthrobacter sp. Hiyo4]|nr:hypothetical protein AHiyo4_48890 [Arthrobacter sp. Hiyo4]